MIWQPVFKNAGYTHGRTVVYWSIDPGQLARFERPQGESVIVLYETSKAPGVLKSSVINEGEEVLLPDQWWPSRDSFTRSACEIALHCGKKCVHIVERCSQRFGAMLCDEKELQQPASPSWLW